MTDRAAAPTARSLCLAAWFAAQGLACIGWWIALSIRSGFRREFLAPADGDHVLLVFAWPDLPLFAAGSLLVAWGIVRRRRWAGGAALLVSGAVLYATLWAVGYWQATGCRALGAAMMAASAVGTCAATGLLLRCPPTGPPP